MKTLPFIITPKASKSEKNKGCEDISKIVIDKDGNEKVLEGNCHETVKPLKLMSFLITMGSREGDIVLDPFAGSGTTCVAAKELKRKYIGIELDEYSCKTGEARLKAVKDKLI